MRDVFWKEETFVELLADVWPRCSTEFVENHCIVAARTANEVGRYFGVPVTERAVKVLVINRKAHELLEAGVGVPDWPEDAWSVGIDGDDERANSLTGYNGHVIAETANWVLDLSAGQFDRPDRNLIVPGPLILPRGPDAAPRWVYEDQRGQRVVYEPLDDRSYRRSRDWRMNWRGATGAAIRAMQERRSDGRARARGTVR